MQTQTNRVAEITTGKAAEMVTDLTEIGKTEMMMVSVFQLHEDTVVEIVTEIVVMTGKSLFLISINKEF